MGILKDILDTINDIKEHVKDNKNFRISNMKMNSISKMSSDAIMQFPVIVSKTLPISDITLGAKALEREYASFVRIAMSFHSNETEYSNPADFIKRFHTNADEHYPMRDLIINTIDGISGTNKIVTESTETVIPEIEQPKYRKLMRDLNNNLIESSSQLYSDFKLKDIIEQYHDKQLEVNEVINEGGIETIPFTKLVQYPQLLKEVYEYVKTNRESGNNVYTYRNELYFVKNTDNAMTVSSIKIMKEDTNIQVLTTPNLSVLKNMSYDNFAAQMEKGNRELLKEFVGFDYDNLNDKFHPNNYSVYYKLNEAREAPIIINNRQPKVDIYNKMPKQSISVNNNIQQSSSPRPLELRDTLLDNDVKKSNELVPTLLAVRVNFKHGDNVVPVDFIVGIKTVVHAVSSNDIIKNLSKGLQEKNTFFNFIRWTTGEIKFLKDFILNVDGIKDDVLSKSDKGSKWWSALKRRKNLAKFRATMMMKKQILPNATIIVSTEEVSYLKNEHGIDLFDVNTVKELMSYYFLLGFVILDPSTELSYFLFDGYSGYQTFSYDALERENTNTAKEIKNIMAVLGKL